MERVIRVFDIGPVANTFGELLKLAHVREHRLATQAGKFANADLLDDGLLTRNAELLFDLHLNG